MTITELQPGRRNKRRLNVYVDGEFAFACFAELASRYGLRKGLEVSEETAAAIAAEDELIAAREYAFGVAARGLRTERQYREKLRARGYAPVAQEAALDALRTHGYLNDDAYAEQCIEELAAKYGKWTVRRKLAERGIAAETIDRLTAELDDSAALEGQLGRLLARPRYEDGRREQDRIIRSLAAKGFEYEAIRMALRKAGSNLDGADE